MINQQIPNDIDAEQAVLGAIIEDNEVFDDIAYILQPDSFYKPSHQHIYRAIGTVKSSGSEADEITIGDQLKRFGQLDDCGGYPYLAELVDCVPQIGNHVYWARIIEEHAILRRLIEKTADIGKRARDPEQNVSELLTEAQQEILEISNSKIEKKTYHIKDVIAGYMPKLEKLSDEDGAFSGIPTGFRDLDEKICGLEGGKFYVLAGRPGMGKSALAYNITEYIATHDPKGAIFVFTFETSREQAAARVMTSNQNINGKKFRTADFDPEDWNRLGAAINNVSGTPIYINKDSKNIVEAMHEARLLDRQVKGGVKVIIFDYIQLMYANIKKNANREQEIATISRSMKNIASDLDAAVIGISSLNRDLEKRTVKIPQTADLRESGALEYDADCIIFIYRDDYYNENSQKRGIADIIIAKQKEGPTGAIELNWNPKRTKFSNR